MHLAVNEINKYADFMKRKFLTEYDIVFIKGEVCFKLLCMSLPVKKHRLTRFSHIKPKVFNIF